MEEIFLWERYYDMVKRKKHIVYIAEIKFIGECAFDIASDLQLQWNLY